MTRPRAFLLWLPLLCLSGCTSTRPDSSVDRGRIDPHFHALIKRHYPETVLRPTPKRPIVFERVRCIGSVPTGDTTLHALLVSRTITDMLSPRGINEILVINDAGDIIGRELSYYAAEMEGTVLRTTYENTGIDLANPEEVRLWSTHEVPLLHADNAVGDWYTSIVAALAALKDNDPEAFQKSLVPKWNSRINGVIASRINQPPPVSLDLSEFAHQFRIIDFTVARPTLSDVDFNPTPPLAYPDMELPWTGIVRARIIDQHDERWDIHFLLAGAKSGS